MDRDRLLSPEEWLVARHLERVVPVSNGPGRGPVPPAEPAERVIAAWLPVRTGQAIPLLGEVVAWEVCPDGELRDCR